jgi:hypothetical protein
VESQCRTPLPLFAGEEGPKPKAWEVRVFSESGVQALTLPLRGPLPLLCRERGFKAYR